MSNLQYEVVQRSSRRGETRAVLVKDGSTVLAGSLVGTDATGRLVRWADAAGMRFVGVAQNSVTGSASDPNNSICTVGLGQILRGVSLVDITTADANAALYCSTDNPADATTSPASNTGPVAIAANVPENGIADLELLLPTEYAAALLP